MELLEKDVQGTLLVKPFNVGSHLRLSKPFILQPNIRASLLAISSQFGWAIIAVQSFEDDQIGPAFILTRVENLSQSLLNAEQYVNSWIAPSDAHLTIPVSSFCDANSVFLTHLAFAASDRLIVAATSDGTLSVFSLQNLTSKTNILPLRRLNAHSNIPVQALIPNPAPGGTFSALIAVLYGDSTIRILDLYDVEKVHWEAQSITAAEWSPMGKRLIVGYKDGKLEYFTHDGQSKGVIEAPTQAEGMEVLHIKWIDQKDYIITFCEQVAKEGFDELATQTFALHVKKQTVPMDYSFRLCPDPTPAQGVLEISPNRSMTRLPTCSPATWRHLMILALSNSTELGIIGFEDAPEPSLLILSEDHRLEIPSSEESYDPASPLGVAATFLTPTSSIIWSYTTDGVLSLWSIQLSAPAGQDGAPVWVDPAIDREALSIDSGINSPPADHTNNSLSNTSDRNSAPKQQTAAFGPVASTAFPSGQATPVSAFGQISQTDKPFGQSAFGQSAFGQSAFGQSAFGQASTSVFGTGQATFGQSTSKSADVPAGTSFSSGPTAFGQPAFGQSAFSTKPPSASTSVFGTGHPPSTSTALPTSASFPSGPTAFGQSAFGQSAFGQSAFGTKPSLGGTSVFGTGQTSFGQPATDTSGGTSFSSFPSTNPVGFAAFANPSSTGASQETSGAKTSSSNSSVGFAQFNNGSASLQFSAALLPESSSDVGDIFGASTSTPSSTSIVPRGTSSTPAVWGATDQNSSIPQRSSFGNPIGSFSGTSASSSSLSFAAVSAPRTTQSFTQLRGASTSPPQTRAEGTETNTAPTSPIIPSSETNTPEELSAQEPASASLNEPTEISLSGLQFGNSTPLDSSAQTTAMTRKIADSGPEQGGAERTTSSTLAPPERNVASDVPTPSTPDASADISLSALQVGSTSSLKSSESLDTPKTAGEETEASGASASQRFTPFANPGQSLSTPSVVEKGDTGVPEPTLSNESASDEGDAAATVDGQSSLPETPASSKILATVGSPLRNELALPSTPPPPSPRSPQTIADTQESGGPASRGFAQFSNSGSSFSTPSKADSGNIFSGPTHSASTTNAIMKTPPVTSTLSATSSFSKVIATVGSPLRNELALPSTSTPASPRSPQTIADTQQSGASASRGFAQFSNSESSFSTPTKGDPGNIFDGPKPTLTSGIAADEGNATSATNSDPVTPQSPPATAVTPGSGGSSSQGFGQFSNSGSSLSTPSKSDTGNIFGGPTERNSDATHQSLNTLSGSLSSFKAPNTFNSPLRNELSFSQHRGSPRSPQDNRADAAPPTSITPSPGVNPLLSDSASKHSSAVGSDKSLIVESTSTFLPGSASVAKPELKQSENHAKAASSVGPSGPAPKSPENILTSMAPAGLKDQTKALPSAGPLSTALSSISGDSQGPESKSQQSLQALTENRIPYMDRNSPLKSKMPSLEGTTSIPHATSTPLSHSISDPSGAVLPASSSLRVNQSVSLPILPERPAGLETSQKPDSCGSISGQTRALQDGQAQCSPHMSLFNSPSSALADNKSLFANVKLPGPFGMTLPKPVSQENIGPSAVKQPPNMAGPSNVFSPPVKVASPSVTKGQPPCEPKLPFSTQPATVSLPITSLDRALVPKIIAISEAETLPSIEVGIEQAILRVVDISSSTLDSLASVCHTCQSYIEGCKVPLRSHDSTTDKDTIKQWQMADIPALSRHVRTLTEQAQIEIARLDSRFQIVRALESGVSKAELKHDEVKRILRAYNDPGYLRVLGSRQLSPVQLARQKSMRRSFQDIKLGTGQVSVALESLRSRLVGIKAGRRQMQPPFLDTINRSVHQLTQALSHHILHIHHLSSRLRALQVAQSKTNQSSLDLVPAHNLGSSLHEHDQTFTESAALQALQNEHTGVRLRDAILGQRRRPILTVPQASDFSEESALSLILPAEPIIIKPRKASSPPKSTLSYECRSPTWFHSPRLSHGRLSEGQSISSPPLAPDSAKAGQWFGSERNSGKAGGWMRGSR